MFFMAFLFSIQYPVDDGSCSSFLDKSTCLHRSTFNGKYCEWSINNTHTEGFVQQNSTISLHKNTTSVIENGGYCSYSPPNYSFLTLLLLSMILSSLTAPVDSFITLCFDDCILAPTVTIVEEQLLTSTPTSSISRRLSQISNTVRRMSVSIRKAGVSTINSMRRASRIGIQSVKDEVIDIQQKALSVRSTISIKSNFTSTRNKTINILSEFHTKTVDANKIISDALNSIDDDDDVALKLYQEFNDGFLKYRRNLTVGRRIIFDETWGPLFNTQTEMYSSSSSSTNSDDPNASKFTKLSTIIYNEIKKVNKLAKEKSLAHANTPTQILGAEMMKCFLVDLLGRDTNEARIFEKSISKGIRSTRVVSLKFKVFMITLVAGLNLYFLAASILYSLDKDSRWHNKWLVSVITNLVVDIIITGTKYYYHYHYQLYYYYHY